MAAGAVDVDVAGITPTAVTLDMAVRESGELELEAR